MKYGLEGVVVAETRLSLVDGAEGRLVIAGHQLQDLVKLGFEGAAELLWDTDAKLGEARVKVWRELRPSLEMLKGISPKLCVRRGLSLLGDNWSPTMLAAAFPIILAAGRHGSAVGEPDPRATQAEDLTRLFFGESVEKARWKALETYITTVCEHGMNASTFCCRVVGSTGASRAGSLVAAYSALCGPLHGGAPGPVLDLLDELRGCDDIEGALRSRISRGERLMGFGHRVYRARDPRADVLRGAVKTLSGSETLEHAERVETAALKVLKEHKPDRPLFTNVEFYTAVLLNEIGFDREWFTPLFATGRALGWLAHYDEQKQLGRLMRPKAKYVGTIPEVAAGVVAPA